LITAETEARKILYFLFLVPFLRILLTLPIHPPGGARLACLSAKVQTGSFRVEPHTILTKPLLFEVVELELSAGGWACSAGQGCHECHFWAPALVLSK
jgi:hypothetical protein